MKMINLIKPLPANRHKEIKAWIHISSMLGIIAVTFIIIMQIYQIQKLYAVKHEKLHWQKNITEFNSIMQRKQKLKQETQDVQKKLAQLKSCSTCIQHTIDYLSFFGKTSKSIFIESIKVDNEEIEINARSNHMQEILYYVGQLSQVPFFSSMKLVSLKSGQLSDKTILSFAIKGIITKKEST
jgi:Tfp pilus assembly protein PilN